MNLTTKVIELLKSVNDWVPREEIYRRGRQRGYEWDTVRGALREAEKMPQVGVKADGYRWYELNDVELLSYKTKMEWFENL